ncbi:RNA 2',3'-cyclic phosphodiesterase [Candidatus Bipolaricaulota bacterium]|nr:RNA 2',3'-cyclic phosphodiesterase [Candidatus Bipolaricaulota bacterium]
MRTFFCLELTEAVKREISDIPHSIDSPAYVKWVSQDNLHVTLKFLGDVNKKEIPGIKQQAEKSAAKINPFEMTIDKLSGFPNPGFPKVIWLGSNSPPGEIFQLQENLESRMENLGFEKENRDYVPHVTLGRTKDENEAKIEQMGSKLKSYELEDNWTVSVDQLTLMESTLKSHGPEYDPVSRLDLGKSS